MWPTSTDAPLIYATCLFCNKPLGKNETFETFPVGKRLAFDAAKGRLWVVCPTCERWNLTPLEERWEAIESAERIYHDARRRVSTDNIGLAKLRDGTELVRIGAPLRPEFAAWRYGDQFGRRRRRQFLVAGGGIVVVGAAVAGGLYAGIGIGFGGFQALRSSVGMAVNGRADTVVAKIKTDAYGLVEVRRRHLRDTSLSRAKDGSLALELRFKHGRGFFEGREAERIASIVIPKVNRFGGGKQAVADAVSEIERAHGPTSYLDRLSKISSAYTRPRPAGQRDRTNEGLFGLPNAHRLALEMALHEEAERRALDGELSVLEQAWREAEEVAGIADNLLTPPSVTTSIDRMRNDGRDGTR